MKKESMKHHSAKKHHKKKENLYQLEEKLVENLVELQKINTNLAFKYDELNKQISGLLTLFELAARSFMDQPHIREFEKDKEFLEKIDRLLDQNKTIARGLTLMEERLRDRIYGHPHHTHHAPVHHTHAAQHIVKEQEVKKEEMSHLGRPLPKF